MPRVDGGADVEKRIRDELNTLKDIIVNTVPVEQIILFSSYANGTPNADSDLDIYVVMPENADIREIDAMKLIYRAIQTKKTKKDLIGLLYLENELLFYRINTSSI